MTMRLLSRRLFLTAFAVLMLCGLIFGASPAFAQASGVGTVTAGKTAFNIIGVTSGVTVNLSGAVTGSSGFCPFDESEDYDGNQAYQDASAAAKAGGDANGCPYFMDGLNHPQALRVCAGYYEEKNKESKQDVNTNIVCCAMPPGDMRNNCLGLKQTVVKSAQASTGVIASKNCLDSASLSTAERAACAAKKKAAQDAANQCYQSRMNQVGSYWAQRREVKCIKDITKFFSKEAWELSEAQVEALANATQTGSASTGTTGSSPGAILPIPSPYGLASTIVHIFKINAKTAATMIKIENELNTALSDCNSIVPGLASIQSFETQLASTLSCQGLSSLIERQLTQCVRVNLSFNLSLPQFSVLTQCPININISRLLGPGGFKCYNSISIGSPLSVNYGHASLLSGNGGLKNLFDSNCYNPPAAASSSSSTTNPTGTRVPGVDCGPLDTSNPLKQQAIQGIKYLAAGTATDGWAVGDSEILPQVPGTDNNGNATTVPANPSIQITRCDYYQSQRLMRTAYVYGNGSSCSTGASGFLDGNFEINTACYGSANYTPAAAPSAPDACMYPAGCLDASGKFNQSLAGTSNCPAGIKPTLNVNAVYNVTTSSGVGGGTQTSQPCSTFSDNIPVPIICCDPQKQDCRSRDANTPLCVCDQGDASNTINTLPGTNTPDPAGSCVEGGNVTCCSPRMQGGGTDGTTWCNANMGAGSICAAELADQCVGAAAPATYTDASGRSQTITATDLATSKPSPYIYLFVRPDAQISGQYCCMTEWCNVCPQEYANAYGLSMMQSQLPQATSDAGNVAILGKGWPFMTYTNSLGVSQAQFTNPLPVQGPGSITLQLMNPPLMMGPDMNAKPLDTAIATCNNLSQWKAGYAGDTQFTSGSMGALFNGVGYAQLPGMQETPLAYMNRIRSSMSSGGSTLPAVPLCSDLVKICTPGNGATTPPVSNFGNSAAPTAFNSTSITSTGTSAPVAATPSTTTQIPVVVRPSTTTNTTTQSTTAPAAAIAPTQVPSATTNNSSATQNPYAY